MRKMDLFCVGDAVLSDCGITGEGYTALASALQYNLSQLEELDMRGNCPGDSGVECLISALKKQKCKLRFLKSDEAQKAHDYLHELLGGNPLLLTELDLTEEKPGDSGVKQFCALLRDSHCRFKKLVLSYSNITEEGYRALAAALKSNPALLEELDLRGNDPGDSGVKLLTSALKNQKCKLRFLKSDAAENASVYLEKLLGENPLLLTELNLHSKKLGDLGVKQFCALLEDSHCRFKKLQFLKSDATEQAFEYLNGLLGENPLLLTEVDLSEKKPGDVGVKQFCALLGDSHCRLKKLKFLKCDAAEQAFEYLNTLLGKNPLLLTELDLSEKKPGDLGVRQFCALLGDSHCRLKKLRLLKTDAADKAFEYLTTVLGRNPLHLAELDLSEKIPGDQGVEQFCAILEESYCRFKTLKFLNSDAAEEACVYLTRHLDKKPLFLTELNLSERKLGDSVVKHICALLKDPHCRFKKIKLVT
ncbi:ribonuclease inhibitor-like [Engraulis encrasicolus]|uniref:ribonuclease inhibitor-like n=1 Tax=Engraulis encrasicolus TaxID=184585 RepID=UPI002FD174ED